MNYYNEFDKGAAQWLRNLIAAGLIPAGDVDERSITEVQPDDVRGYTQCHFFAGIGGWSLALRLAGWSSARPVWTGSCPCQPFSVAGKRNGTADERHLWPEFQRLIAQCKPAVVFGEQVASKAGRLWLAGVRVDLEALGYGVGAADLCAAGVSAPHVRQRLYWMADSNGSGFASDSECDSEQKRGGEIQQRHDAGGCGEICSGLAHGHGHGQLGQQGSAQSWTGSGGSCDDRGPGDAEREGLERYAGHVANENQPGWVNARTPGSTAEAGSDCGVSDNGATGLRLPEPGAGVGCSAGQQRVPDTQRGPANLSAWGDNWIDCADGKARRIEPGLAPLAHGIPARVVRLRGYGNAIVPPLAAEFIGAYMESAA